MITTVSVLSSFFFSMCIRRTTLSLSLPNARIGILIQYLTNNNTSLPIYSTVENVCAFLSFFPVLSFLSSIALFLSLCLSWKWKNTSISDPRTHTKKLIFFVLDTETVRCVCVCLSALKNVVFLITRGRVLPRALKREEGSFFLVP